VLALLLLERNRSVPVEAVIDALWGPCPPPSGRGTVQAHVSRLRVVLRDAGAGELVGRQGCYELRVDPDAVDAGRLERLVGEARGIASARDRAAALAGALALVRGPALADLRYLDAFASAAERLDELALVATEERIDAQLAAGDHLRVVSELPALIEAHPYRERLHGQVMVGLYRSGRQAEALRAYQSLYRVLADEVGVVPSAALRELEQAIAVQDPRLDLVPEAPVGDVTTVPAVPPGMAAAWRDALEGRRRLVVATTGPGEATDPAAAFVAAARGAGALVLDVAFEDPCPEDPFGPITAAFERGGVGAAPRPAAGDDPVSARYRYFEAVAERLQQAASARPVVLRLRSLHRAGRSTILLVEHLVRHRDRAPVLLVADAGSPGGRLGAFLLRLQRDDLVTMVDDRAVTATAAGDVAAGTDPHDYGARVTAALRRAAHLAEHAGHSAMAQLGFEDATDHFRVALDTLALAAPGDDAHRAHLLIAKGRAEHAAYLLPRALATFGGAVDAALAAGDDDLLAEAAVGLASATEYAMADEHTLDVLERALTGTEVEPGIRVRLLAGVARLRPTGDPRALAAADEAVRLARCGDDRLVLAHALAIHVQATWSPRTSGPRLAAIDEIVTLADELQSLELAVEARNWRSATLEELGRMDDAARDRAIVAAWADQSRLPFIEGLAVLRRVAHDLHAGRLDAAEDQLGRSAESVAASPNFRAGFLLQYLVGQRLRGRAAAMVDPALTIVAEPGALPGWRVVIPLLLVEAGRNDEAAHELRRALPLLGTLAEDWLWLGAAIHLADAAILLGDAGTGAALADRLAVFAGRQVVAAHGVVLLGSVRSRLGALAALGERADLVRAETDLRAGVAEERSWGARPWSIASRALLAEVLARRGGYARLRESAALIAAARADARALGVDGFASLLTRAEAAGGRPAVRRDGAGPIGTGSVGLRRGAQREDTPM
jgi:DNA-binding SARP family transcriptional activator